LFVRKDARHEFASLWPGARAPARARAKWAVTAASKTSGTSARRRRAVGEARHAPRPPVGRVADNGLVGQE